MEPTNASQPAAAKPKSKTMLIVIVAVIVLAGGGGAGYWWWAGQRAEAAAEAEAEADTASESDAESEKPVGAKKAKKKVAENPGLVEFPGFLVNLADAGGQSYLRVTLNLLVADEAQAKEFTEKPALKSLVRSAILEVLALQVGTVLVTPEGKAALKHAIIEKIESLERDVEVSDVLFSDFVVQY